MGQKPWPSEGPSASWCQCGHPAHLPVLCSFPSACCSAGKCARKHLLSYWQYHEVFIHTQPDPVILKQPCREDFSILVVEKWKLRQLAHCPTVSDDIAETWVLSPDLPVIFYRLHTLFLMMWGKNSVGSARLLECKMLGQEVCAFIIMELLFVFFFFF